MSQFGMSQAMKAGIQELRAEDDMGTRNFSYLKEVQPIWDKHCISCHDGVKHKMSLKGDLKQFDHESKRFYNDSYINLTHTKPELDRVWTITANPFHPEVNWIDAMSEPTILKPYHAGSAKSNIIKRMKSGHGGVKPSESEIRRVAMWIDLLVPFVGDYRESNNWSKEDHAYYDYYDQKRESMREMERENIRQLVEYQKSQK